MKINEELLDLIESEQIILSEPIRIKNEFEYNIQLNLRNIELQAIRLNISKEEQFQNILNLINNV